MAMNQVVGKKERRSLWISHDSYSLLNRIKQQFEASYGETDWGKFLAMMATYAMGAGIIASFTLDEEAKAGDE